MASKREALPTKYTGHVGVEGANDAVNSDKTGHTDSSVKKSSEKFVTQRKRHNSHSTQFDSSPAVAENQSKSLKFVQEMCETSRLRESKHDNIQTSEKPRSSNQTEPGFKVASEAPGKKLNRPGDYKMAQLPVDCERPFRNQTRQPLHLGHFIRFSEERYRRER